MIDLFFFSSKVSNLWGEKNETLNAQKLTGALAGVDVGASLIFEQKFALVGAAFGQAGWIFAVCAATIV